MSEWVLILVLGGNIPVWTAPKPFESPVKCEAAGEEIQRRIKEKFQATLAWACIEQRRS